MPIFISEDDLAAHANDASFVATKADDFIRGLQTEIETVKAAADAAAITAEQTCSLLEHKFVSLSSEYSKLESEKNQLQASLDERLSELADIQANKHQLHLQKIGKDGEIERLNAEVSELHKSKRQLVELVQQKDSEISEKNATINTYLDRIVALTENAAQKETRLSETVAEMTRVQATCSRLSQEKELIERHNAWLNDELTSKVDNLLELRKAHAKLEEDMSAKIGDLERQFIECSTSLKWKEERTQKLESLLSSLQEELCSCKDAAAANEERLSGELSTVNKLVELYKESSEEWSRKAGELEGVIKALETHLSQVETDYKNKLEKEASARKHFEKEAADLKHKLERCEAEIESIRKANELSLISSGNLTVESWMPHFESDATVEDNNALVPKIPAGVSGTALAASLLRDGWSLAKMYAKYQEAVDALRHEQLGRKESEAVLQRVLYELEEKAGILLDERAEYDRMVESYSIINQKLQHSISEQATLERTIRELKADLKRQEREYNLAKKESVDLERQVAILLKECRDLQLRGGSNVDDQIDDQPTFSDVEMTESEKVISQHLLTFKDINGLVEQNVQLRTLVRNLSDQIENKEKELMEKYEVQLSKQNDEATSRVAAVLKRAEEQGNMIEALHTSVAMYKRLYEEEQKLRSSDPHSSDALPDQRKKDVLCLLEGSQQAAKKAQEKTSEQLNSLEQDLAKARNDITSLRSERDKLALDAKFATEKLDSFMKEFEYQRNEKDRILSRNIEFQQLIVDFQRKLQESSEAKIASEELQRKLSMEVSILKNEKEMLSNAEKRACGEVRKLSERVHQLQTSLDTIQSAQEVREEARAAERRKQEEYIKQLEREWADAKKELQEERDAVRALTSEREQTLKNAMSQVEEIRKELTSALHAASSADTRAAVAESKLADLENKIKNSDLKAVGIDIGTSLSQSEVDDLHVTKEEVIKLKEEARVNKEHMQQYKSIAQVNEAALKQMEAAHENFKRESEKLKKSLEAEISSLRKKISELEEALSLKTSEVVSAAADKEEALASALAKITSLKEESSNKDSQINLLEIQLSGLKEDLEKEHERWRSAQANYERQVILQSETIQELTKTSQALAALREDESELRKLADALKCENNELKMKWETEKSVLEKTKNEAENRYNELNEQNKILHSRLEALHIQLAEKDRSSVGTSDSTMTDPNSEVGLQNVVNYLRRSKEIAETEISLFKQEKLRLQSQLERATKDAETAKATLQAERTNSRALLFSEEEIKSLQLQVSEINLLRESNLQLREENKHNFEECQKLRELANIAKTEKDNTESRLRERETEIEALKKEIEMEKIEKSHLEVRVSELLEKGKTIDLQDYKQMKDQICQMQEKVREKDVEIEEIKSAMSKQQETMSKLEQDLKTSESELSEREKRINAILQTETYLKSELEKQKKITAQWKKKYDSFSKEKDELSKEKQALLKQIEDLKHNKKLAGGASGEQILKDREEKDHRIQILEKTLERQREELRKEREDHKTEKAKHQNTEKAMMDSVRSVDQVKANFESKLEKHKNALKQLSEELEKVKHAETDLPEGTSVVQILSGTILDDLAGAYASAVGNFERVAHSLSIELGVAPPVDTPQEIPAATTNAEPSTLATSVPPVAPTSNVAAKAAETTQRRPLIARTSAETRRTGRKLVRPRLGKPEEPQGDTEMFDVDGSSAVGKAALPQESESQRTGQPRKRIASSVPELNEQSLTQGEGSSDIIEPAMKRAKESEHSQEIVQGLSAASDIPTTPGEEPSESTGDLLQGSNDDGSNDKEEPETDAAPSKESELGGVNEGEALSEKNDTTEENLDKPSGSQEYDDGLKDQTVEDSQPSAIEIENDREEGELLPEAGELEEAADGTNIIGSPSAGDGLNQAGTSPVASPMRTEDETLGAAAEPGEINSPEPLSEDKNEEGDGVEEAAEASDKSNEGTDQTTMEAEKTPENAPATETTASTTTEAEPSKQATPSTAQSGEVKQPSPVSHPPTLVNLSERAKQNAALRQSGGRMFSPQSRVQGRQLRDRGGGSVRGGRGVRGRGGRGQPGGQQG